MKLAGSEQWEQKSQQGKFANAQRKTVNRTGNRGLNGVRESLREILGRSPDPDEMYAEARRDKGFAGLTPKKETVHSEWEDIDGQELSDEDGQDHSGDNSSERRFSDDGVGRLSHVTTAPPAVSLLHICLLIFACYFLQTFLNIVS